MKKAILGTVVLSMFLLVLTLHVAYAVPTLQLYIEGAEYDALTETWVIDSPDFILWVIGDVESYGPIETVTLSVAYDSTETGTISLTPTVATSGLLPPPGDTSISNTPTFRDSGSDTPPLMGNGSPLPAHGIYEEGTSWETYVLDDFTLTDSPIGDYTTGKCPDDPSCTYPSLGQINAYEVSISGYSWVHFDAFNHIVVNENHSKYRFAPFSHDTEATPTPEPKTFLLLGSGLVILALATRSLLKGK